MWDDATRVCRALIAQSLTWGRRSCRIDISSAAAAVLLSTSLLLVLPVPLLWVQVRHMSKCRGRVLQTGLLDGTALTNLHSSGAQPVDLLKSELSVSAPSRSHAAHESSASSHAADSSAVAEYADAQLRAENENLKWQLAQTKENVVQWQQLHGELHAFCVDKVLKRART